MMPGVNIFDPGYLEKQQDAVFEEQVKTENARRLKQYEEVAQNWLYQYKNRGMAAAGPVPVPPMKQAVVDHRVVETSVPVCPQVMAPDLSSQLQQGAIVPDNRPASNEQHFQLVENMLRAVYADLQAIKAKLGI